MRLLVDTNIFIDCLANRQPFARSATLLMIAGKVGEFELWMSSSQATDLIYILSNGGKKALMPQAIESMEGLLSFVNVYATGKSEIFSALTMDWDDPEDALLYAIAQKIEAQAVITRNKDNFAKSLIPVYDADEFFLDLRQQGTTFDVVDL